MNKVILMGRLTRNPDIRWSQGQEQKCTARYTLAVDRKIKAAEGQQSADFISCVSFGKVAEFVEKYCKQGTKLVVCGRIQTGSYTNRDGQKVYTTDVVVEQCEFAESKNAAQNSDSAAKTQRDPVEETQKRGREVEEGFMTIPDGVEEELPFI